MSCYLPILADNSTFDVCCFNSLECAKAVCGSFELLNRPDIGINTTLIQANGTQYCNGYAELINQSYTYIRIETCGNSGFLCNIRKNSPLSSSSSTSSTINPMVFGIWVMGLWILSKFSRN